MSHTRIVVVGKPLGRLPSRDPRNAAYPSPYTTAPTVSVRWQRHAQVLDQGSLGSCTGNACLGAIGTSPLYDALASIEKLPVFDEPTAVKLYSLATQLDGYDGAYPPDDTGSDGPSVAKAARQDGWLSGYTHAADHNAALAALAAGPVITGVDWYEGFDDPTTSGEMRLTGSVRGGHELVVDEIDVERKRVWITNSWGTSWGIDGRAWWSWATWQRLLDSGGDATVLIPVTVPKPDPTPTPVPDPGAAPFLDSDPALAAHVDALVNRGRYPDRVACILHALRSYFHLN